MPTDCEPFTEINRIRFDSIHINNCDHIEFRVIYNNFAVTQNQRLCMTERLIMT